MTNTAQDSSQNTILYKHVKRPNWGLAILAWTKNDKRGYQFEDGKLRVFKAGFFNFFEEVDPPADRSQGALVRLNRALGRNEALRKRSSGDTILISLNEQIAYYKEKYPDGFLGKSWKKTMRGLDSNKIFKRHRDPAIKMARKKLSKDILDSLITKQEYDQVIRNLIEVLNPTDLVTATKLRPLREAPSSHKQTIALTLRALLYDSTDPFTERFNSFVASIGKPSWELATAPLALVSPKEHVCVRPSVFKKQAIWMAPRLEHPRVPTVKAYQRYLEMTKAIATQLKESGMPIGDFLDVHDFIYETLRPTAEKDLKKWCKDSKVNATAPKPSKQVAVEQEAA
jgi:hypothetical protein